MNPNIKPAGKKAIIVLIALVICVITAITLGINVTNERVPAGYCGYMIQKPLLTKSSFKGTFLGPTSTGLKWRYENQLVSITPFTYSEDFPAGEGILAKDKLVITSKAHMVWRIDVSQVQEFMESFGGLAATYRGRVAKDVVNSSSVSDDKIAQYAYNNFIREPFRTELRTAISQYNALDASSKLTEISEIVLKQVRARLKGTPFIVDSIVVGETTPPKMVVEAVERKVSATQELERKVTELEIAQRDVEIQKTKGLAQGEMEVALANKKAEAIRTFENALGPKYLQYISLENLKGAQRIYLPMGPNGLPTTGTISLDAK